MIALLFLFLLVILIIAYIQEIICFFAIFTSYIVIHIFYCIEMIEDKIYEWKHFDRGLKTDAKRYLDIDIIKPIAGRRYICESMNGLEYISEMKLVNMVKMSILSLANVPRDIMRNIKNNL